MGVGQSRIGVTATHATPSGPLQGVLEADFHNASTGTSGLLRVRHAYAHYGGWTLGQTWTTFFDPECNPSQVDFEGPNSSTLNRAPLLRYTHTLSESSQFSVAAEHPSEEVTAMGGLGSSNQRFPDLAAGVKALKSPGGHIYAAGIAREIRYTDTTGEFRGTLGWGIMGCGKVSAGQRDNLKFQVTGGRGIARYIEGVRGLGYDAVADTAANELQPLWVTGGYLAFQHFWGAHVHSSLIVGDVRVESTSLLLPGDFRSGTYGAVNLFWQAARHLELAVEVLVGSRTNQDGADGAASRLQFGAKVPLS